MSGRWTDLQLRVRATRRSTGRRRRAAQRRGPRGPRWFLSKWAGDRSREEIRQIDYEEFDRRFELTHAAFDSQVDRRRCPVGTLGATLPRAFDLAFCCNLLQHLRDPVNALENIRETLLPGGRLILGAPCDERFPGSYAVFSGSLEPHLTWWMPSPEALLRMCTRAGFENVEWKGSFELPVAGGSDGSVSGDGTPRADSVGAVHAVAR